jgi:hypothetical protein
MTRGGPKVQEIELHLEFFALAGFHKTSHRAEYLGGYLGG